MRSFGKSPHFHMLRWLDLFKSIYCSLYTKKLLWRGILLRLQIRFFEVKCFSLEPLKRVLQTINFCVLYLIAGFKRDLWIFCIIILTNCLFQPSCITSGWPLCSAWTGEHQNIRTSEQCRISPPVAAWPDALPGPAPAAPATPPGCSWCSPCAAPSAPPASFI